MPAKANSPQRPLLNRWFAYTIAAISLASIACAWARPEPKQTLNGGPSCQLLDAAHVTYPAAPIEYPAQSDAYQVQFSLNGGPRQNARVYASYYGASNSSPFVNYSGYVQGITSMTTASIPAPSSTDIEIRVTKLGGLNFPAGQVTVRPTPKPITVEKVAGKTAWLSLTTPEKFLGDQFILSYTSSATENSALQGLAIFRECPLSPPKPGPNVRLVQTKSDMNHLDNIDTLDFEGVVGDDDPYAFYIPAHVKTVYFGDNAWIRGKIIVDQDGTGRSRKFYGHGVIDASRFNYSMRHCGGNPLYFEQGLKALSFQDVPKNKTADTFTLDGFTISDTNFAATDPIANATINDVKVVSWNSNNGGFLLGDNNVLTNVFLRDGDDSIMLWGTSISIVNATVWQNYNGGVVNLGWGTKSRGDNDSIDGLYVVKTDWLAPKDVSWTANFLKGHLANQNNAVFDSLMTPGTKFGQTSLPIFSNVYIEDAPRVLFSLKIDPPHLDGKGGTGDARHPDLRLDGDIALTIQNLSTPPPILDSQIGFQTIENPANDGYPKLGNGGAYTLHGNIDLSLTNIEYRNPDGTTTLLTHANAPTTGMIETQGHKVKINYGG